MKKTVHYLLGEITQNNVHMLILGKVTWMVEYMMTDNGMDQHDALKKIYSSQTYKKLAVESTNYWHWSPVDLYRELMAEN